MLPEFKVYWERFCKSQDIVVGAPGVTFYEGEHWVVNGFLAMCQQIEQRVWVGLRYAGRNAVKKSGSISIASNPEGHRIWLPGLGEPVPFEKFRPPVGSCEWKEKTQALEQLLDGLIKRSACQDFLDLDGAPVELSILSEVRSGSGCDFSGAFSVAAIVAIHLAAVWLGKVKPIIGGEVLTNSMAEACPLLGKDALTTSAAPKSAIDRINRAALVLETYFHGGRASGYGTFCPLLPSKWPIAYIRETPTSERIPETIPIGWEEFDRRPPTEAEWAVIDRHILDPPTGLQYLVGLFENDKRLVPDPEAHLPFAFGLVYSGNPKDTKSMIGKVKALRKDIKDNLPSDLAFLGEKELWKARFPGRCMPIFFEHLKQLASEEPDISVRAIDAGGSWAAMLTVRALCRLFRSALGQRCDDRHVDADLEGFADSIQAAQGGLSQLLLVDADACRIIGRLLDAFMDCKGKIAAKYTGGARGGHLLCIGPPTMSVAKLRECLMGLVPEGDNRPEWDRPRVDYWSEEDPPQGEGVKVFQRSRRQDPERGRLIRYSPSWGRWMKVSEEEVGEWQVERLIRENLIDRCVVELDMRSEKNAKCRVFTGGEELSLEVKYRRGINALAHMLSVLLERGGSASNNELLDYAREHKVKMQSYIKHVKQARALITGRLRAVVKRPQWFDLVYTEVRSPKEYRVNLKVPDKRNAEVFVYIKHQ